jgi:putative heme-binding domain-containing protein
MLAGLLTDSDPEVAAAAIRSTSALLVQNGRLNASAVEALLQRDLAPLESPTAPSTRDRKIIKVREAYDREFQRYLTRLALEPSGGLLPGYLDSQAAERLPLESRLLASLALDPKAGASRVARLLPKLTRSPDQEEVLRLAQFADEPGAGDALGEALVNPVTRAGVAAALLNLRSKLNPEKLGTVLKGALQKMLTDPQGEIDGSVKLAGAYRVKDLESELAAVVEAGSSDFRGQFAGEAEPRIYLKLTPAAFQALTALRELQSTRIDLFEKLATRGLKVEVRDEAIAALAASKLPEAAQRILALYPRLEPARAKAVLDKLSSTKPGAEAIVGAVDSGALDRGTLDSGLLDRLLAVLGDDNSRLNTLIDKAGVLFRPVLALDGSEEAWCGTNVSLPGAFTVETWIKLEEGLTNADGILGSPGKLDINFHDGHFRVWAGPTVNDVAIAKKKSVAGMWRHVAATRSAAGEWKLYVDGELDAAGGAKASHPIEQVRVGWTAAPGGTKALLAGYRIWSRERSGDEIRRNFDREIPPGDESLVFASQGSEWGQRQKGAKVTKTSDLPPLLTANQAAVLDEKFARFSKLATGPGNIESGKAAAVVCRACHLMGAEGGQIGPNLSGVGAMGTEAILRNILTPNAAMESAYRIYRVEQRDGSVLDAFFVSEDKDAVIVRLPGSADQRIARKDVVRTQFLRRSLMPEGLLDGMPDEQVRDLFAYLKSLR